MRATHFRFFGTSFYRIHGLSSKEFLEMKQEVILI